MLVKSRGIVLSSIKYSESSIITKIYTEEFGMLSFMVRGVRKRKARISASFFQAFTLLNMDISYKPKSNLQNIKELGLAQRTDSLHSDIRKSTIALFLAEILHKSLEEEMQDKSLFDFLQTTISFLDSMESSLANFHLIFMLQLSKYLGFYPSETIGANQQYFNMESGIFESNPYSDQFLNVEQSDNLKSLMKLSYLDRELFNISSSQRRNLLNELIRYYQLHLPGMGRISSQEVLESVFK
ncbi:MAG: DNA repair protein RecO [Bacteroidales bacterium]|nr:DNA repair protein RecO [Bacteroidales bacterium]